MSLLIIAIEAALGMAMVGVASVWTERAVLAWPATSRRGRSPMPGDMPRIAILGLHLESNAFAPVTVERDFRELCWLEGEAIMAEARKAAPAMPREIPGFVKAMDASGAWMPVPIFLAGAQPSGPIDHDLFERLLMKMRDGLAAAGRIDAVYVCNHGAMTTTREEDPDGVMLAMVREQVGADLPIACTLDLHTNVSERMVDAADVLLIYRTNPHVDQAERAAEAAAALREMLAGLRPKKAFIRLPFTPASVALLTAPGSGAFAELIEEGKRLATREILDVSIGGGFVFSDTRKNGIAIAVTSRGDQAAARRVATELAAKAWRDRERYLRRLMPLDEAVRIAKNSENGASAAIFADSGDNPGGGGRGNTTDLLLAMHRGGAKRVLFGNFVDPALAQEAHQRGVGAKFCAVFNRDTTGLAAERFEAEATVLGLLDEDFVGRRGIYAGRRVMPGKSATLALGGITVAVISRRYQCADPMFFERFGIDVAAAATICVKSRGHFRAGFDIFFPPERVHEVDSGGLTSPVLDRLPLRNLPRPVFPLDRDTVWNGPNWA
jgi:microcystin degradation protein MlrC